MKKVQLIILYFTLVSQVINAQQIYDDFEGTKLQHFGTRNGTLDSTAVNPAPNNINNSQFCAKYKRSNAKFDNLKIYPNRKLSNVASYASYTGNPPKITMKVYTSAPVGTKVEIQLGKKGDDNYPSGIHSQYEAITKTQNAWEELSFTFSQIPKGSAISINDIDKLTILFAANSTNAETFYFDDINIIFYQ